MTLLFALFVVLFAASKPRHATVGELAGAIHSGFHMPPAARTASEAASPAPVQPPKTAAPGAPVDADLGGLEQQLRTLLQPSVERNEVALLQTREGLVLSFREFGFFHTGAANLLPGQATKVIQAGEVLAASGVALRIEGHSDNRPIHNMMFASNWELSTARAMTVLLLLVDGAHYDPTRVALAGYGPYRPVADNTTVQGRQQNRRVDVVIPRKTPGR